MFSNVCYLHFIQLCSIMNIHTQRDYKEVLFLIKLGVVTAIMVATIIILFSNHVLRSIVF
jgi:uncharacterized membrane protein YidH (DUF202 family)